MSDWKDKELKDMGTVLAKICIRSAVLSDLEQITHALSDAAETSSDTDLRATVKTLTVQLKWATSKVEEIKCLAEKATAMPTDYTNPFEGEDADK